MSSRLSLTPAWRITILLIIIFIVDLFIISAGFYQPKTPWSWPTYTAYYSKLADGFLHGHLNLRDKPPPQLLALPDPYDPRANHLYRFHDAILFNGKYYLYWGPVPALIIAAVCKVIGVDTPTMGDQYLVFAFLYGTVALTAALTFLIRRALFPNISDQITELAIATMALGAPFLYTLARSEIYEQAIVAGQFFMMAALLLIWLGIRRPRSNAPLLLIAGLCLALAFGSRLTLAPACLAIALLAGWRSLRLNREWTAIAALLLPVICGAALMGWYNYARFGDIMEFGLRYQTGGVSYHTPSSLRSFTSLRYIPVNLYRYILAPPEFHRDFPFIEAAVGMPKIAESFSLPHSFIFEPVAAVVWFQPFLLLSAIAAAALWWKRFAGAARNLPDRSLAVWITLTLVAAGFGGIAPALAISASTMRYLLDAEPGCTILAALGMCWLMTCAPSDRARTWIMRVAVALVAVQIVLAMPLAITGYRAHFASYNPVLFNHLKALFGWL